MSISYAHIAAGSKADTNSNTSKSTTPEPKAIKPFDAASEESQAPAVVDKPEESSDDKATSVPAAESLSTQQATSSEKESAASSGAASPAAQSEKGDKKQAKKVQLNLAPAPVPAVSAWGKPTASSTVASSKPVEHDNNSWPSPLTAINDTEESIANKKPVAKSTGKEKWVPYEASVVISSSAGKSSKSHGKRSNRKKHTGANSGPNSHYNNANNAGISNNANSGNGNAGSAANVHGPAANSIKGGKLPPKASKKKAGERKDETKPFEKDATKGVVSGQQSANTPKGADESFSTESNSESVSAPLNKDEKADDASAKFADVKDTNQTENGKDAFSKSENQRSNGIDSKQNGHREHHHNSHHYNGGNTHGNNFHHSKNARYIRSNYNPYKGKPHGNKHYYNNHNHNGGNDFKHGGSGLNNNNGFVPFKQQQIPFVPGFIPQGGNFKHQPPAPFVPQFYPPYNANYYAPDIGGLPMQAPKVNGKGYNQTRFFNSSLEFAPIINPKDQQFNAIINQVCYYFSVENLVKDIYLRKQMDNEGFVPVKVIANFYRVQTLSGGEYELVVDAIKQIDFIELKDDKVRLINDYQQWILPSTEKNSDDEQLDAPAAIGSEDADKLAERFEKTTV